MFDSPIEQAMWDAFKLRSEFGLRLSDAARCEFTDCRAGADKQLTGHDVLVFPQVLIGPYRLDFLAFFRGSNDELRATAIECDGHEFHEKTKEQAARDKKRDRYLALHSITVLRFAGSEVWSDACECAEEAHRTIAFMQAARGVRSVVWLGYLSEEECERRRQDEEDAYYRELARKEERKREFASSEIMSGTYEGYYP